MSVWWQALAVFVAMFALDVVFALYVVKTAERAIIEASAWAALVQVCNVFVVTSFVKDRRMALPCVVGAFAGTWFALAIMG